jgi:TRAP-type C4-dicarboxylate transport system substrate-binding protein
MKRRKWVTKGFVFGMMLLFAALSQSVTSEAAPATINLSFNNWSSAENWISKVFTNYGNEIEKGTNGQVKITLFSGGVLSKADQVYDGLIKGISEIGYSELSYTLGRFPLMEITYLPYGAHTARQASRITHEIYKKFQPKEFGDVHPLYFFNAGPLQLHMIKEVNKLEDMKGLKIRVTPLASEMAKALGAIPVGMPMPDCYEALRRGVVDGMITSVEPLVSWKLAEVVKSTIKINYGCGAFFVAMNRDKWNSLSPEIKKVFEEVSEKYPEITGGGFDENDEAGYKLSLNRGNKVITLPPEELKRWQACWRFQLDKWVSDKEAMGLPARAVLDEVIKLQEKYK